MHVIEGTFFFFLTFYQLLSTQLLGAMLGITDKMEAQPQPPLFVPQAQTQDEGLRLVILTCIFLSLAELTEKEY